MTRLPALLVGAGLILAGSARAAAPQDPGALVLDLIYGKLAASFSAPGTLGTRPAYLVPSTVGIPVTLDQTQDSYELSVLLDQIPAPSSPYTPTGQTFSGLYNRILQNARVSRYQNQTALEQVHRAKQLTVNRRRHGRPTPWYTDYLEFQADYAAAVDAEAAAQAENQASGAPPPPGLEARTARALALWILLGHKPVFDAAFAAMNAFFDQSPAVLFSDQEEEMLAAAVNDSHPTSWFPVVANPPMADWLGPAGWTDWSFQAQDVPLAADPNRLPTRPGAGSVPGSPTWLGSLAMTAQLKRVSVTRPWLDPRILQSHAWSQPDDGRFSVVATGNPLDPNPGPMPILVTGVLLARNLKISGAWDGTPAPEEVPTQLGPFALASPAAARRPSLRPFVSCDEGSLSLQLEGTQIIGFFCEPLPKCPDPDPRYFR